MDNTLSLGGRDVEMKSDMFVTSWDMKRAFDSLGREFTEYSLWRMGVPEDVATYMCRMDA